MTTDSIFYRVVMLWLLLFTPVYAAETVQLKGMFDSRAAVLVIDGKQSVVRVNERVQGVTLLSVGNRDVVVRYNGQIQKIPLSRRIGANYKVPVVNTVRIASQQGGHYWTQAQINGKSIRVVVDTGATAITLNFSTARRLGIDHADGKVSQVATANGTVAAKAVALDSVTIGSITRHQVQAVVLMDDSLPVTLLGNSFLSGVDMRTEDGVLILTQR
jgi:aspartyl protease family protein